MTSSVACLSILVLTDWLWIMPVELQTLLDVVGISLILHEDGGHMDKHRLCWPRHSGGIPQGTGSSNGQGCLQPLIFAAVY
jgi:hypothetical protein